MWRAAGIILLLVSQDLGRPFHHRLQEFSIRPPANWMAGKPTPPAFIMFTPAERPTQPCGLEVKHLHTGNPTPLRRFVEEAKPVFKRRWKDAVFQEEKELTINGRPAYRIVFSAGDRIEVKTVIPRSNLEFYLVDAWMGKDEAAKYRPAVEAAVASFRIVPLPLTSEERSARARTMDAIRTAGISKAVLGETWHAVYLGKGKTGHQRTKVSASGDRYALEVDVLNDFGKGGKDTTRVRAEFSADGSYQRIEREQEKVNPEKKWTFNATATLQAGRVKVQREMNGYREEREFPVQEAVFFTDIADVMRRVLVTAGRGDYVIHTLSPYSDEPDLEAVEVTRTDRMEVNGKTQDACVVFAVQDRRRNQTFTYGADGRMLVQGGPKDIFKLVAVTKEEALKKTE